MVSGCGLIIIRFPPLSQTTCNDQEIDIMFLLDSSGSIGDADFEIARDWLISVAKSFQIGKLATQVSVMQFADDVIPEFDLDDYDTIEQVENALKNMRLSKGGTNIAGALKYAAQNITDPGFGARASAPKVVVLLTDGREGRGRDRDQTEIQAKLLQKAASVFIIGIGKKQNTRLLNGMATEPISDHVKSAETYEDINKFKSSLTKEGSDICAILPSS